MRSPRKFEAVEFVSEPVWPAWVEKRRVEGLRSTLVGIPFTVVLKLRPAELVWKGPEAVNCWDWFRDRLLLENWGTPWAPVIPA